MMGRQKKQGNQFPHNKKLVQKPEGNEENRHSDPLCIFQCEIYSNMVPSKVLNPKAKY
jgi:hypothetical protein